MNSREPVFEKFNQFGQSLLDERHSNADEIKEKMDEVQAARQALGMYGFFVFFLFFFFC